MYVSTALEPVKRVVVLAYHAADEPVFLTRTSTGKTLTKFLEINLKKTGYPSPLFEVAERILLKTRCSLSPCFKRHDSVQVVPDDSPNGKSPSGCRNPPKEMLDHDEERFHIVKKEEQTGDIALKFMKASAILSSKTVQNGEKYMEIALKLLQNHTAPAEHMLFNCEPNPVWEHKNEALYYGLYRRPGQRWKSFTIPKGELPTKEELASVKSIIISGSCSHVYDETTTWIPQFMEHLRMIYKEFPRIKIIGICFGMQVLAHSLGGEARKMTSIPPDSMVFHMETLELDRQFFEHIPGSKELLNGAEQLKIYEFHGDEVVKLPPNAVKLATSVTTKNEMFLLDGRFWGMQGHPEFSDHFLQYYLPNCLKAKCGKMLATLQAQLADIKTLPDSAILTQLVQNFLFSEPSSKEAPPKVMDYAGI